MTSIILTLPSYEPKINENNTEKVDLNIRDLQDKYTNGCICCGTTFYPRKFSSMIASHFNTAKHKKKCLNPANYLFKEEFGSSSNLKEAFDSKCKELREEKKLAYEYKEELEKLKFKCETLEKLNIKLQERISDILNPKNVECENLIDL
jgi:hypothetical protein